MSYTDNNKGDQMFNDIIETVYAPAAAAGVLVEIARGSGCLILSALVSTGGPSWYERLSYYGYTAEECLKSYLDYLAGKGFIIQGEDE
jgi:hypothetical protein